MTEKDSMMHEYLMELVAREDELNEKLKEVDKILKNSGKELREEPSDDEREDDSFFESLFEESEKSSQEEDDAKTVSIAEFNALKDKYEYLLARQTHIHEGPKGDKGESFDLTKEEISEAVKSGVKEAVEEIQVELFEKMKNSRGMMGFGGF